MYTPYDWQEAIGHRAQFVEAKLALGTPVVAASFEAGILMLTYRRQARKIFEVYDQLIMGAIGQQSDIEAVRLAAIDFSHREGYSHSEEDVTLHRLLGAISIPVKRAFSDFSSSPIVAECLFAEVSETPEQDQYAILEYDGDYRTTKKHAFVAMNPNLADALSKRLEGLKTKGVGIAKGFQLLDNIWKETLQDTASKSAEFEMEPDLNPEMAILERRPHGESRYRHFTEIPKA
jgi:proteasome alpha subunit